jgi:plasmid stabilization system protein ParE
VKRTLVADIRPQAREDVDSIAGSVSAGARFLDDFDAAIDRLLQFPELAQVWQTNRPDNLSTVRRFVMRDFHVSIFYRPTESTLEVLRVLHHSRDVLPLLEDL